MYYEGKYRKQREKKEQKARDRKLFFLILIPVVIFIALGAKILELEQELAEVNATLAKIQYTLDGYTKVQETSEEPIINTPSPQLPSEAPEQVTESPVMTEVPTETEIPQDTSRKVYLTFDDGPSAYTTDILDILDDYNVKATFFVLGKEDEVSVELLTDIYERGHTIGMHSYSHKYHEIYASKEAFIKDYTKLDRFLTETIGVNSFCYRFPGGSSNTISKINMSEFADFLDEQEITFFDWNISSGDGSTANLTVEQIEENVMKDLAKYNTAIVLMHDSVEKRSTVDALPGIIEAIQSMENTKILPITEDTVPIQHITRVGGQ